MVEMPYYHAYVEHRGSSGKEKSIDRRFFWVCEGAASYSFLVPTLRLKMYGIMTAPYRTGATRSRCFCAKAQKPTEAKATLKHTDVFLKSFFG